MRNPELQLTAENVPAAEPQTGWRDSLRNFIDDDTGSITLAAEAVRNKWVRRVGTAALATLAAGGFGYFKGMTDNFSIDRNANVTAEPAQYEGAFVYDVPKICWGGYQDTYSTKATYNVDINAKILPDFVPLIGGEKTINTGDLFSVAKQSQVTEVICTEANSVEGSRDADGAADIRLKKGDFTSYVFATNPTADKVDTGNGFLSAPQIVVETFGKALQSLNLPLSDKLPTHSSDDIRGQLEGLATLEGTRQSTEACSALAWQDLAGENGPMAAKIAEGVATMLGTTPDKVKVTLPDSINLKDQYDDYYKQLDASKAQDSNLHVDLQNDLKCEKSPDYHQVVTLPAGVQQPQIAEAQ